MQMPPKNRAHNPDIPRGQLRGKEIEEREQKIVQELEEAGQHIKAALALLSEEGRQKAIHVLKIDWPKSNDTVLTLMRMLKERVISDRYEGEWGKIY